MAVAGRRNDAAAERRQLPLDPLPVGRQNLLDERLIALRVARAGHLALQLDRADDVREQKCLEFGHGSPAGRYSSWGEGSASRRPARLKRIKKARPAFACRRDGLGLVDHLNTWG